MSEVFDRVKKVIVQQLSIENEATITPEASFIDLGADSLDTIELIMAFTDEFGIEFPEEESENILTVQDVVNYIESHS